MTSSMEVDVSVKVEEVQNSQAPLATSSEYYGSKLVEHRNPSLTETLEEETTHCSTITECAFSSATTNATPTTLPERKQENNPDVDGDFLESAAQEPQKLIRFHEHLTTEVREFERLDPELKPTLYYNKEDYRRFQGDEQRRYDRMMMKKIQAMVRGVMADQLQDAINRGVSPEEMEAMMPQTTEEIFALLGDMPIAAMPSPPKNMPTEEEMHPSYHNHEYASDTEGSDSSTMSRTEAPEVDTEHAEKKRKGRQAKKQETSTGDVYALSEVVGDDPRSTAQSSKAKPDWHVETQRGAIENLTDSDIYAIFGIEDAEGEPTSDKVHTEAELPSDSSIGQSEASQIQAGRDVSRADISEPQREKLENEYTHVLQSQKLVLETFDCPDANDVSIKEDKPRGGRDGGITEEPVDSEPWQDESESDHGGVMPSTSLVLDAYIWSDDNESSENDDDGIVELQGASLPKLDESEFEQGNNDTSGNDDNVGKVECQGASVPNVDESESEEGDRDVYNWSDGIDALAKDSEVNFMESHNASNESESEQGEMVPPPLVLDAYDWPDEIDASQTELDVNSAERPMTSATKLDEYENFGRTPLAHECADREHSVSDSDSLELFQDCKMDDSSSHLVTETFTSTVGDDGLEEFQDCHQHEGGIYMYNANGSFDAWSSDTDSLFDKDSQPAPGASSTERRPSAADKLWRKVVENEEQKKHPPVRRASYPILSPTPTQILPPQSPYSATPPMTSRRKGRRVSNIGFGHVKNPGNWLKVDPLTRAPPQDSMSGSPHVSSPRNPVVKNVRHDPIRLGGMGPRNPNQSLI